MQKEKRERRERRKIARYAAMGALPAACIFLFTGKAWAAADGDILAVLTENSDIFVCNNIFMSGLRAMGWGAVKLLAWLAAACAELFDNAFRFVDFTELPAVQSFIASFKPVFVALICLSLVFLGLILIFWHEKKPKLAMNICLAVLIVTSSSYLIREMNGFLATEVRGAIISEGDANAASEDMVYQLVGSSVYDLLYLDANVSGGLMSVTKDNRMTYGGMGEEDVKLIDINEIVKPEDVQDGSQDLMGKKIHYFNGAAGTGQTTVEDIYDGVAWTDLLNEYYYRYSVSWINCVIGLISIALVYICLAYKVVRLLYEIAIHQLLAYLYSANLTSSQKTLKILDTVKDSYITIIVVLICVKIYVLSFNFINSVGIGGITKAILLLFVALAVIDGPNIVQKLTGVDAGMSSGIGKMIAGMQAARMMRYGMSGGMKHIRGMFGGQGKDGAGRNPIDAASAFEAHHHSDQPEGTDNGRMPGAVEGHTGNSRKADSPTYPGVGSGPEGAGGSGHPDAGPGPEGAGGSGHPDAGPGPEGAGGSGYPDAGPDPEGAGGSGHPDAGSGPEGAGNALGGEGEHTKDIEEKEGSIGGLESGGREGSRAAPDMPEGTGYQEGAAYDPESGGDMGGADKGGFSHMEADLNGMDPLSGDVSSRDSLAAMEEELSRNSPGYESIAGRAELPELSGTLLQTEGEDRLDIDGKARERSPYRKSMEATKDRAPRKHAPAGTGPGGLKDDLEGR